ISETSCGARGIEQYDVTHRKLRNLVVLGHHRAAGNLKYRIVVICAGEADIPVRPLGAVSVAGVDGREPAFDPERGRVEAAYAQGPYPAGKGVAIPHFRPVPTARTQKRTPPLEVQLRCSGKIVAHRHCPIHIHRCAIAKTGYLSSPLPVQIQTRSLWGDS